MLLSYLLVGVPGHSLSHFLTCFSPDAVYQVILLPSFVGAPCRCRSLPLSMMTGRRARGHTRVSAPVSTSHCPLWLRGNWGPLAHSRRQHYCQRHIAHYQHQCQRHVARLRLRSNTASQGRAVRYLVGLLLLRASSRTSTVRDSAQLPGAPEYGISVRDCSCHSAPALWGDCVITFLPVQCSGKF
jgi:hypothetical protein